MISLLFSILFAAEPKMVDIDYKIESGGLESLKGKVTLEEGSEVSIGKDYSMEANIVDTDELYIKIHKKTKDKVFTEIITFDGIKAEVETSDKKGESTRLEIQPHIL